MIGISIDPGVITGVAVFELEKRSGIGPLSLVQVRTLSHTHAQQYVLEMAPKLVLIEDARKRNWFGHEEQRLYRILKSGKGLSAKDLNAWKGYLLGAGSVQRSCQLWEEYCKAYQIPFLLIAPKAGMSKLPADKFKALTGFDGSTNQHGRDAAMVGVRNQILFKSNIKSDGNL